VSRPTSETRTIVTGGAVVSTTWDENGRLHVRVDIDGIPDSRLIDDAVPLDISVGDNQVFPPISDDDDWDDEL
jgi:YD repeat-containing protein